MGYFKSKKRSGSNFDKYIEGPGSGGGTSETIVPSSEYNISSKYSVNVKCNFGDVDHKLLEILINDVSSIKSDISSIRDLLQKMGDDDKSS